MPAPRLPLLTLIVHIPGAEDRRIDVFETRTVIGRSSANDVQIVAKQVSKVHAAIELEDDGVWVHDLGSRNGVEVNGLRVHSKQALRGADRIALGDALLTIDPNSVIFQPPERRSTLSALLDLEDEMRRRAQSPTSEPRPIEADIRASSRPETVLVGHALNGSGGSPVLVRLLRVVDSHGPRESARIETFALQTESGLRVWVRPLAEVQVHGVDRFPIAEDAWIDESEDFASGPRDVQIVSRSLRYLPVPVRITGVAEAGFAPDGFRVFSEASAKSGIVLSPA